MYHKRRFHFHTNTKLIFLSIRPVMLFDRDLAPGILTHDLQTQIVRFGILFDQLKVPQDASLLETTAAG